MRQKKSKANRHGRKKEEANRDQAGGIARFPTVIGESVFVFQVSQATRNDERCCIMWFVVAPHWKKSVTI
jgi:hypothetical protein